MAKRILCTVNFNLYLGEDSELKSRRTEAVQYSLNKYK